jgi:tetratricopeptide (TPR) repeat protein
VGFLQWELKRIPFKIEVPNVNEVYAAEMRKELLSWPGFDYHNWQTAAQFCADHKVNLAEALVWADKAISEPFKGAVMGHEDFATLSTKAAVLQAMGKESDAEAVMNKALQIPGTEVIPIYSYGMHLMQAGKKERALEIFKLNRQLHPDDKFLTSLGLARGYTAVGDKENAIKNWEVLVHNVPDNFKAQLPRYEAALKKLKEGS